MADRNGTPVGCETCRTPIPPDEDTGLCDTCSSAWSDEVSIEEARLEVEDLARSMTARFASAEGKPCTCGAGCGAVMVPGPKKRGPGGGRYMGVVHFDVHHADDCPRSPGRFDWDEVDEDARERVFGYRGRPHHLARLAGALREVLHEREVFDV